LQCVVVCIDAADHAYDLHDTVMSHT